jgi:hypothetical protein
VSADEWRYFYENEHGKRMYRLPLAGIKGNVPKRKAGRSERVPADDDNEDGDHERNNEDGD